MTYRSQSIRSVAGLALSLVAGLAGTARAETVVLKDGSTITGELVGFENGEYRIKIGRFVKSIPEGQIQDVRDSSGDSAEDGGGDSAAADAPPPDEAAPPPPEEPDRATRLNRAAAASQPSSRPARPAAGGGSGGGVADMQEMLRQAMKDAGVTDADNMVGSQGMQDTLQSFTGGRGSMSAAELDELQKNPQVQEVVNRYTDPEYQNGILGALEDQWGDNPDSQKQMQTLRSLFDYLNQVKSK